MDWSLYGGLLKVYRINSTNSSYRLRARADRLDVGSTLKVAACAQIPIDKKDIVQYIGRLVDAAGNAVTQFYRQEFIKHIHSTIY